jgi:hypothetical protein
MGNPEYDMRGLMTWQIQQIGVDAEVVAKQVR